MIRIQIQKNKSIIHSIQVDGHAGYAPHGYDILCASVSTLLQVVGYTLKDVTKVELEFERSGFGRIEIKEPSLSSSLVAMTFEKGAILLADQYPEHVSLEMS